jgi:hypothetical protein
MLGAWAAGVGTSAGAGTWTAKSARCSCRTTIEDWLTALDSGTLCCGRSWRRRAGRDDGSLINRSRASLRHYNATDWRRCRWRRNRFSRTMSRRLRRMSGRRCCRRCGSRGGSRRRRGSRFLFNRNCGNGGSCRFCNRRRRRSSNGWSRCRLNGRCRCHSLWLWRCGRGLDRMRRLFLCRNDDRRLDDNRARRRNNGNGGAHWRCRCGGFGNNRPRWRLAGNGARGLRCDDRGRRPCLGNNLSWFWTCGSSSGRRSNNRSCRLAWSRRRGHSRWFRGHVNLAGLSFFFLLPGQYSLHHVAGLGNIREINFGRNVL